MVEALATKGDLAELTTKADLAELKTELLKWMFGAVFVISAWVFAVIRMLPPATT